MVDATDHDQLFKTVVRTEFRDFLSLFVPELAARFDLSTVKWLDKELFTNPPDGPLHVLDLVAELTTLGGDATTLALVHVEVESADSVTSIETRLPDYYHYLRRSQRKPVQPLVVFLIQAPAGGVPSAVRGTQPTSPRRGEVAAQRREGSLHLP